MRFLNKYSSKEFIEGLSYKYLPTAKAKSAYQALAKYTGVKVEQGRLSQAETAAAWFKYS